MAFGWYRLAKGKLIRKLREKEKLDCRLAITPYLQAEADLEYLIYINLVLLIDVIHY